MESDELMKQAVMTAQDYLAYGVEKIDRIFDGGYAKEHPELVGAFIQTCAADFHTTMLNQTLRDGFAEIASNPGDIEASVAGLGRLRPNQ